jgi:hypothetical protein
MHAYQNLNTYVAFLQAEFYRHKPRGILIQARDKSSFMEIALFGGSIRPNRNWDVSKGTCHKLKQTQKIIWVLLELMLCYICLQLYLLCWQWFKLYKSVAVWTTCTIHACLWFTFCWLIHIYPILLFFTETNIGCLSRLKSIYKPKPLRL